MPISINAMNKVVGSDIPNKTDFMLEENRKQVLLSGIKKYIEKESCRFKYFEKAVDSLNIVNNSYGLVAVEAKVKTQIKAVREMQLPESLKSNLILFFDDFINGLSFY